ncbi:MAG TPA: mersacidin/lichenicidin family type 2 lantibiotic [Ktedonosporobacter sp.]|nr:mersacidin/lichenicidin family type 2 lantibiotic [Ktedonosporobacter sp.]
MSAEQIVKAWKDAEFRQGMSAEEQTLLPEHPSGFIEVADEQLSEAAGGTTFDSLCCLTGDNFCQYLVSLGLKTIVG